MQELQRRYPKMEEQLTANRSIPALTFAKIASNDVIYTQGFSQEQAS